MTDLLKELLGFYKEKTKLPIVSTYVILLIVWNWDILSIYLFSSVNMETRVCWIKNIVPGFWDHVCRILVPAVIAFTYPFITNYLMYYTDKWLDKSIQRRTNILNQRNIITAKARFQIKEAELGTSNLKQLEAQIQQLEVRRDSLTTSLESANRENEEINGRLNNAIAIVDGQSKEMDVVKNENRELKLKLSESSYVSLSESDKNITKLIGKYSILMNRWKDDKIKFFVNMRRGQIIEASNKNLFSMEEYTEMMKNGIFETSPNGFDVVSDIGDNLAMYLKYKRASE
ncbi:MAG: hypothetical protein RSF68_00155 [Myroides sp.]